MKIIPHKLALAVCSCLLMVVLTACDTTPGLVIIGRLIDKEGKPIVSEQVMLGHYRNVFDQLHAFSIPSIGGIPFESTTDEQGMFQIQSADSGQYVLLYRERIDGEESLHALTDKYGHVLYLDLSETKGASVGTITILTYPDLPKKYLPDFLSGIFLGMSLDKARAQEPNLEQAVPTKDHIMFNETKPTQGVEKIEYGFDTETNRLEKLEIWYTGDTSAYRFGEETFGIPNYQSASVNDGTVINWRFDHGNNQVVVTASRGKLEFSIQD